MTSKNFTSDNSERLRVARDLHDTIAQEIAALGYFCDEAISVSAAGGTRQSLIDIRARLSLLSSNLRDEIGILRESAFDIHFAINQFLSHVATNQSTEIRSELSRLRVEDDAIALELYRAIRELISNTLAHAHATYIFLQGEESSGRLKISVEDDGIENPNFAPDFPATPGFHFGAQGVRERIESLGGALRYERIGKKNSYTLEIPQ